MNQPGVRRRMLLGLAAMGGAGFLAGRILGPDENTSPRPSAPGIDSTGHAVSAATGAGSRHQVLSGLVHLDSLTIGAGQTVELDPQKSTTVTLSGNLVVYGTLRAHPADSSVVHEIHFDGVDETRYVGGGMSVLDSDVGVWVMDAGRLDLVGTERAGWNRAGTSPTWRPGDEILRAPIAPGSYDFVAHTPGDPVPVASFRGVDYPTEVFNLTRNVIIRGRAADWTPTPGGSNGRAHVFIHSSAPQVIRFVELRHLAPRKPSDIRRMNSDVVLGRYALHFHHCGDGSRGSVVEGVVGRENGGPVFVPHESAGITFTDCVAYRSFDYPYWWDLKDASADLLYDRCAAFTMRSDPDFRGSVGGFLMGRGINLEARDCVAVDNRGTDEAAGFHWPSKLNRDVDNIWTFRGCRAHNNQGDGLRVWQNDEKTHVISDLVTFHNRNSGVDHGAYRNDYRYERVISFGNATGDRADASRHSGDVVCKASSRGGQRFDSVAAGQLVIANHIQPPLAATIFDDLAVDSVYVAESVTGEPGRYQLSCAPGFDLTPADVVIESMHPATEIEIRRSDGTSFRVQPAP